MNRHGTRTRYQKGCRCDDCTAANTKALRAWRERRTTDTGTAGFGNAWEPVDGCLGTLCWCGRKVLAVRVEHVRAGMTYSCGAAACVPPAS